jgi:hypothetical protein
MKFAQVISIEDTPSAGRFSPLGPVDIGSLATFPACPSFPSLFDQKPDNRQRCDAVNPPRAEGPLGREAIDPAC